MSTFTADDLAKEAERELRYRHFVYSKLIGEGKLNPVTAQRRIAMMEEIASHYRAEAEAQEAKERLL
jgi:hypothetical protein